MSDTKNTNFINKNPRRAHGKKGQSKLIRFAKKSFDSFKKGIDKRLDARLTKKEEDLKDEYNEVYKKVEDIAGSIELGKSKEREPLADAVSELSKIGVKLVDIEFKKRARQQKASKAVKINGSTLSRISKFFKRTVLVNSAKIVRNNQLQHEYKVSSDKLYSFARKAVNSVPASDNMDTELAKLRDYSNYSSIFTSGKENSEKVSQPVVEKTTDAEQAVAETSTTLEGQGLDVAKNNEKPAVIDVISMFKDKQPGTENSGTSIDNSNKNGMFDFTSLIKKPAVVASADSSTGNQTVDDKENVAINPDALPIGKDGVVSEENKVVNNVTPPQDSVEVVSSGNEQATVVVNPSTGNQTVDNKENVVNPDALPIGKDGVISEGNKVVNNVAPPQDSVEVVSSGNEQATVVVNPFVASLQESLDAVNATISANNSRLDEIVAETSRIKEAQARNNLESKDLSKKLKVAQLFAEGFSSEEIFAQIPDTLSSDERRDYAFMVGQVEMQMRHFNQSQSGISKKM